MHAFRPWGAEDAHIYTRKQYLCKEFGLAMERLHAKTIPMYARNWGLKRRGECLLKGAVLSGATCREELRSSVLHIIKHVSTVIVLTVMISLLYTLTHTTVPSSKVCNGN